MRLFRCTAFACRLTPAACVARQDKAHGSASAIEVSALQYLTCRRCEQGARVRERLERAGRLEAAREATARLKHRRGPVAIWRRKQAMKGRAA